ncbi:MAG TPA: DUF502 domain-containing protein [Bacteroidales bacterium]|nr:DUF502 domain-containing protein [Bacteroidales bacterium]
MKTRNTFRRLLNYFFQGLLFLGPLAVTIYAVKITFLWIDGLLYKHIEGLLGLEIPGLGLVTLLLFITLIGFLGSLFFFKPFLTYLDRIISRMPLIKIIYTSVKDLMSAFVGNKRRFNQPVLVRIGGSDSLEKIGFITNEDLSELGITDGRIAVYLPHSYAWSGNLFIVPVENVTRIDASATDVMKYIISAGVTKL